MNFRGLWIGLGTIVVLSFGVLVYYGIELYQTAPPIPRRVVTTDGRTLFTREDIQTGQTVWMSTSGQELGSVWGHGAYVAPDWTADFLHREATYMMDHWAADQGTTVEGLSPEQRAALEARLRLDLRTNTYDPDTGTITISPDRAAAIAAVSSHYDGLFGSDPEFEQLRDAYAMKVDTVRDPDRRHALNAFFWWTSWAAVTQRPRADITYTNNWPSDPLVGNTPAGSLIIWSVLSFVMLLAGIGALAWYFVVVERRSESDAHDYPKVDPLLAMHPTPSMRATLKYFWVVTALIVVQIGAGVLTAHYGVEGSGFYGFPLAKYLPYAVTRTWHLQLGLFWIATAWLATGLFIAPAVSGYEPKYQRTGVNVLFVALLIIVIGSMAGEWYATMQTMDLTRSFWFGHQGLEYLDLGRLWQILLFIGLFFWLYLMTRALWPALTDRGRLLSLNGRTSPDDGALAATDPRIGRDAPDGRVGSEGQSERNLLVLFVISALAIAGFYGAGLAYNQNSNYSIIEYWRWWVVHLWVEGFFEVFATVVIAFLFTRMGLLKAATATAAVLFSTIIFLTGGIIGTFHHLYFTGTPTAVLAFGAVFSALEVVPLTLIGFKAYEDFSLARARPWVQSYKWPIYFFVGVAFWNLVGAGLFGFLINPPIALYYMQGLNTTPAHSHTALFGVYGLLGMGLMLFCLKGLTGRRRWKPGLLAFSFWSINIGLALMVLLSLLPIGLLQTWASVEHGLWYARSAEFMQTSLMNILRWLRIVGDTIFAIGAVAFAIFVAGLKTGWSLYPDNYDVLDELAGTSPDEREVVG